LSTSTDNAAPALDASGRLPTTMPRPPAASGIENRWLCDSANYPPCVTRFLLSFSGISRRDSSAAVFGRDSQNSTFLHHSKVTDSDVRDLSFGSGWVCPGELQLAAAECGLSCKA
jgi:hypothetical protein